MPDASNPVLILVQSFFTQAVGYFTVVGLLFLLVWKWGGERFRRAKIPSPAKTDAAQVRREIGNTFVTFAVGTLSVGALLVLKSEGLTKLSEASVLAWETLLWVVGFIAFNDLWFYSWHRLLHTPWFFRHVHSVHHKSIDVNPFTSYSFHAFEGFILGAWLIPAALVLPIPMSALGVVQVVGLANNVNSHLGHEFLPRWVMKVPLLKLMNTSTFHSLHHTRVQGNFGLFSRVWDRLFGTELTGYEEAFVTRGDAARPSDGQ
jgi:sterol desaturase/sphingolipid hydroxylase (fatty acid hydroxylase superfamily)